MRSEEAIAVIVTVCDRAKLADQWSDMLVSARSVSESDTRTLERVLRERQEIVALLHELGAPHDPFDHKYVHGPSLAELLRRYVLDRK